MSGFKYKDGGGASDSFSLRRAGAFGVPAIWVPRGEVGSLFLHVAGALRLRCRGAEVLPAEGGEQHGSRQVHGRQVMGRRGEAGL